MEEMTEEEQLALLRERRKKAKESQQQAFNVVLKRPLNQGIEGVEPESKDDKAVDGNKSGSLNGEGEPKRRKLVDPRDVQDQDAYPVLKQDEFGGLRTRTEEDDNEEGFLTNFGDMITKMESAQHIKHAAKILEKIWISHHVLKKTPLKQTQISHLLCILLGKPLTQDLIQHIDHQGTVSSREKDLAGKRKSKESSYYRAPASSRILFRNKPTLAEVTTHMQLRFDAKGSLLPGQRPIDIVEAAVDSVDLRQLIKPIEVSLTQNLKHKSCEDIVHALYAVVRTRLLDIPFQERILFEASPGEKNCCLKLKSMNISEELGPKGIVRLLYSFALVCSKKIAYDSEHNNLKSGGADSTSQGMVLGNGTSHYSAETGFKAISGDSKAIVMNSGLNSTKKDARANERAAEMSSTLRKVCLEKPVLRKLYTDVAKNLTQLEQGDLCELAYSVYKFNFLLDEGATNTLSASAGLGLSHREPQEEAVFKGISTRIRSFQKENMSLYFTPKNMADLVDSCSKFGYKDKAMFDHVAPYLLKCQTKLSQRDFQKVTSAYIKFNFPLKEEAQGLRNTAKLLVGDFTRPSEKPKHKKFEYTRPEPLEDR